MSLEYADYHSTTDSVICGKKPEAYIDDLHQRRPLQRKGATGGANGRTRTGDRLFTKQLLYRLSYIGIAPCRIVVEAGQFVKREAANRKYEATSGA